MYEEYFGFAEKPFSLTPDPRYLYRSEHQQHALEVVQHAIRRRDGLMVVTGEAGTGKTSLFRALVERCGRDTFASTVANPFLSPTELLRRILQDFGIVSRCELRIGRLAVSNQDLHDALRDFLVTLPPLRATALLVIDEAQNLPPAVLEQIRMLSNLETDTQKLLQIVLVGHVSLQERLCQSALATSTSSTGMNEMPRRTTTSACCIRSMDIRPRRHASSSERSRSSRAM